MDRSNRLWIGTASGVNLFDKEHNSFKRQGYNPSQSWDLSNKNITAIFEDSVGRLWIGTSDGGLGRIDGIEGKALFFSYRSDEENLDSISHNFITAIEEDEYGALWVGTRSGLNRFIPETGIFERFLHAENKEHSISNDMINDLHVDMTGNLWIATAHGLNRLASNGVSFIRYESDPAFSRSLSNDYVLSIYEDRGGVLWFGTYGGGINRYDRQRDKFAYYRNNPKDPNSLSENFIFAVYVDSQGYTWIGTFSKGLNRFDTRTNQLTRFQNDPEKPQSLGSNEILSIVEDKDGVLWIGTTNGLDRYDRATSTFTHFTRDPANSESIGANIIYDLYVDRRNNLWIATVNGLDRLDRETGAFIHYYPERENRNSISGNKAYSITEDKHGNIWVGTFSSGLNKFDPKTGKFTRYRYDPKDKTSISNDSILSVHEDSSGRLWIGTAGGGLNLYHPETDSFSYYLEKDGLPNGVVYGILEDEDGNLWMSTNFGISRFDPETETFRNFDQGDGLQSNEFNSGAYARGKNGEFYFGGINGLTVFHPSRITDNPYVPQVTLTSLTQDDQPILVASSVETADHVILHWPQNSLDFEFAALSFNQPNKNQYAYMLEGFDSNWHFIDNKRNGRYTNLPGGEYTLLLKGSNSDGVWAESAARIRVNVIPPFWQTTWFRVLLSMTLVVAILGGIRLRTKTIQDRNRQLERLVRERTGALETRNQEIQALYQADERILRNVSLLQVFQTLVDVAVDTLHADRSVVFAWDEKQTKVVPRVSHGFAPETLKVMEFEKGEGIVGHVLETGKAAIVRQIELNDFRPDVRAALVAEGIRSFVHLPIIVDHKVVGVFNVGFIRPNLIGDDTMRLFSALTHRASISIANMELFEQTKDLAVMEERNRLARDLHDSAKQKAFAALAQLGTARGILNGHDKSVSLHLGEAENLVSDVIQELTFLVQEIYPIALQEKGLSTVIREHIFEWENRNDIMVQFTSRYDRQLSLEVEQALYRVTQETLANIARHSRAHRVDMSLVHHDDAVQLSVSDDGCGFDVNLKPHGMGLRSIRERISSIHGTVQIQSAPGHGTRLLVQVPTKG
jgi:ligand-binding sensor domain-containing protein/signal transduction histidine kinase